MSEKKILYIRLDSSPLPEACDEIIVKDFNLESYFCTLLGKRLLGECSITQSVPFPGKIVSDFKGSSPEIYSAITTQWENILTDLLAIDDMQGQRFEINIPFAYFDWLSHHENPIYRELGKISSQHLFFMEKLLYEDMIACVLMKRLRFTLSKITDSIDHIVVSLPIVKSGTPFISYIMQLNDKFNGSDIIDRQMFIDTYVTPKRIAEKKKALEIIYELSSLREGRIRVRNKKTKKYGFVNEQMELVVPCEYDFCGHFVEGLAFAYDKNKKAYQIDKSGNIQDLPSYDYHEISSSGFSDGLTCVLKDSQKRSIAYINTDGKETINVLYSGGVRNFKEGFAAVLNSDHKYGFINKMGAEVIPCQFDYAEHFSEGLANIRISDNWGFVDRTGKIVIPCKYSSAGNFSEKLARVSINCKYGFIDKTGNEVIPCQFDYAGHFSEGLANIQIGGKYGFINQLGEIVISCKYSLAGSFSEGLASVEINDKIGFIDKTGEIVIPCKYSFRFHCESFSDGLVLVSKEFLGSQYFINKKGEVIVPPNKYRDIKPFHDGLACVDGGYIDNKGNEIIPPGILYSQDCDFSERMAWIKTFINGTMRYALIKKEWIM